MHSNEIIVNDYVKQFRKKQKHFEYTFINTKVGIQNRRHCGSVGYIMTETARSSTLLVPLPAELLAIFTCVSYAEACNRYRLDVCPYVCPSVRTSVRPSVTRWYCIKTAEHIVMLSSPHDSPFILALCVPRSSRNSDGVTPCGGTKYRWGIKICAIIYQ